MTALRSLATLALALSLCACAGHRAPIAGGAADGAAPADLRATTWDGIAIDAPDGRVVLAPAERYGLAFVAGGRVAVRADCNRATGAVRFPAPGRIALGPLAATRAMCAPGSASDRFLRELGRVSTWARAGDELHLSGDDGATRLRLRRASP